MQKTKREFLLPSGTIFRFDEYSWSHSVPTKIVCCLHGLYQTSEQYQPLIEHLFGTKMDPHVLVLAINLTNFGVSLNAVPQLTTDLLYQDLHFFYTKYKNQFHSITEWINVAYSISTCITLLWYAYYPEDAKSISLTVLCAPLWFMSDNPIAFPKPHYFFGIYFKKNIFKNVVRSLFKNQGDYEHIVNPFNQSHNLVSSWIEIKGLQSRLTVPHDKTLFLNLNTPIHLVYGEDDFLCPSSTASLFTTCIPNSIRRIHILNGVGHFHLKQFKIINDLVLAPLLGF
jgi:pimeloyl-ACP methyl ester carboxylesterase